MLPEVGTKEREQLETEAMSIGLEAIHDTNGNLPEALYQVYEHFREKLIEEYELMDSGRGVDRWANALHDARTLERYVSECWATAIVHTYTLRASRI